MLRKGRPGVRYDTGPHYLLVYFLPGSILDLSKWLSETVPKHSLSQACASFASLHLIPFPNAIPAGFSSWTSQSWCKSITLVDSSLGLHYFRNFELKNLQRIMMTPEGKVCHVRPAGDLEARWHGCSLLRRRLVPCSVDKSQVVSAKWALLSLYYLGLIIYLL